MRYESYSVARSRFLNFKFARHVKKVVVQIYDKFGRKVEEKGVFNQGT